MPDCFELLSENLESGNIQTLMCTPTVLKTIRSHILSLNVRRNKLQVTLLYNVQLKRKENELHLLCFSYDF